MPELPEVETVVRGLNRLIVDKTITSVDCSNQKSFSVSKTELNQLVINASVNSVVRRAKIIIIHLSSGYSLLVHLKMTGQLVFRGSEDWGAGHPSDSLIGELPDKSTRLIIYFSDFSKLYFNDQRKFGWVKLFKTSELATLNTITKLGPEPLEPKFTDKLFIKNVSRRSKSNIKAVLLDQTVLSGIGNIYADEALFNAGIHPESKVGDIPIEKLKQLKKEIVKVLQLSIEQGGSTNKNYVNAEGKRGSYLDFANVYARTGLGCNICSRPIVKIRTAGRGTHICTNCQKRYSR